MLIDTHAHVTFDELVSQGVENVIDRAKSVGVGKIINIGCDIKSSEDTVRFANEYEIFYATVGLHPYDAKQASDELMERWKKLILENKKIVGVGECGLDYFKAKIPEDVQKSAFRLQIDLAKSVKVPLIVHCREAYNDCLEILDEKFGWIDDESDTVDSVGGYGANDDYFSGIVFHCYSGTLEFAEKLWKRGIMTSFTGIVTYPNAKDVQEVAREVPMNLFMVETDCPYLAPQAYRGNRNEPAYVLEVAKQIAKLKEISFEEVCQKSTDNAQKFFARLM